MHSKKPSLDEPWAIGVPGYRAVRSSAPKGTKKIIEFGSGVSTFHLAVDFPEAQIFSFEHSDEYLSKTRARLDSGHPYR